MDNSDVTKPLRLLVIDDDPVVAKVVSGIAMSQGMLAVASNHSIGIDFKSMKNIDVLVLDLMMPDMDGIELVRKLSEINFSKPIILLSGLDLKILEMAKKTAIGYGFNDVQIIKKPVTQEKLLVALSNFQDDIIPTLSQRVTNSNIDLCDIKRGLRSEEFFLTYQPQLSFHDFSCCGIEVLVRWSHPSYGIIYPDAFITLVEGSELVTEFTLKVIDLALNALQKLVSQINYSGYISINIPPSMLTDPTLSNTIISMVSSAGLPFEKIQLEITERSLSSSLAVSNDILARLAMRGIKISIDDFGTGNAGLDQLSSNYFHELKIDKAFVLNLLESSDNQAIVRHIIELGHDLGMLVVAEGIENEATLTWLKAHDCDVAQGYYLAKPIRYSELVGWLETTLPTLVSRIIGI